jgi:DNA-binding NarL/FixJ family response regulator
MRQAAVRILGAEARLNGAREGDGPVAAVERLLRNSAPGVEPALTADRILVPNEPTPVKGTRMQRRVSTYVYADDPILQAGVISQLGMPAEIDVVESGDLEGVDVGIAVADVLDDETIRILRSLKKAGVSHTILVMSAIDDSTVVNAAEAGVSGLLRRGEATPDVLVHTIQKVASGEGVIPSDLLGHLLGQVGRLQRQVLSPRGLSFTGLSDREVQVLRLIADGLDTDEIARQLCYSQRTVKNVLHDVTTRLQLRNRSHAVAYAVREGLI